MDKEEQHRIVEETLKKADYRAFKYDGLMWPPLPGLFPDPERKFKELYDFQCRDSDVFLCSYPKSGTHWTFEVICMLIKQSAEYDLLNVHNSFLELIHDKDSLDKRESPRLFITHVPYRYLPRQLQNGTGRSVYVQRNPKDIHVSFYIFIQGRKGMGKQMTWNEFFEDCIIGKSKYTDLGDYSKRC